jgi:hypothetical protein
MSELLDWLREAGFRGKALKTMYGIVMAESGGNPRALNDRAPDLSYGLSQINMIGALGPDRRRRFGLSSNDDLYDPVTNLRVAFRLSRGGRDFTPWTTYTSGRYKDHALPGKGGAAVVAGPPASGPGAASGLNPSPAAPAGKYLQALGATVAPTPKPTAPAGKYLQALGLEAAPAAQAAPPARRMAAAAGKKGKDSEGGLAAPGGGWGGSYNIARSMMEIARGQGLSVMSEKRETKMTASGGVSDHWQGSKDAYAYDLSNGQSPTPEMDETARRLARLLGVNYDGKSELVLTKTIGGYRYQILYRTSVGGNHFNHVHVGVRRAT